MVSLPILTKAVNAREFFTARATPETVSCLQDNVGSQPSEYVPGLSCLLEVERSTAEFYADNECGSISPDDNEALLRQFDEAAADCGLYSIDSSVPPELSECLD